MIEHLNTFKGIVNQLKNVDMNIGDELQTFLLLSSLLESWDILVVTLSNSALDGKLSMDNVTDSLLNEESRRKEKDLSSHFNENVVENRGRNEHLVKEAMGNHKEDPSLTPKALVATIAESLPIRSLRVDS